MRVGNDAAAAAEGDGGRIEWSLRPIAAKRVIGMWQPTHWFPVLPGL